MVGNGQIDVKHRGAVRESNLSPPLDVAHGRAPKVGEKSAYRRPEI
jgi:hypothetical protein